MKKILTIDFDIIMYECEEIYNNKVPYKSWKELQTNPIFSLIYGNLNLYNKLTQLLLNHTKFLNKENFHFIESHDSIINFLPKNQQFSITNIDQNHDIAYNEKDGENLINEIGCANWVKYCFDNNYPIEEYNWINSNTSSYPPEHLIHQFIKNIENMNTFNIKIHQYDEVIICLSRPWVPPNYQNLFFNWMDIIRHIYNTTFILE